MTKEEIKALVERYPYLLPRNVWTDEVPADYDYTYIKYMEIPQGWERLFFQMCEDIRQPLVDAGYLEKFRFTQVKEKYNSMCCYHAGAPEEVCNILAKYEQMAGYICTNCGKPAVYETQGYIASFCEDCYNGLKHQPKAEKIEFKPYYKIRRFQKGESTEMTISFEKEWNRYIKENGYDTV